MKGVVWGAAALSRLLAAGNVAALLVLLASGFCSGGPYPESCGAYGGGAEWPREYIGPFDRAIDGRYFACHSMYANPYGLEDLRLYQVRLGARFERLGLGLDWIALSHPLYRGDRAAVRIGSVISVIPIAIVVEPAIERKSVYGFPAEYASRFDAAAVVSQSAWAFALGSAAPRTRDGTLIAFACSADLGPFAFALNGRAAAHGISGLRAAVRLSLDEAITLSAGYRTDTDELCWGLTGRHQGLLVTFGWSDHPALGSTVAAGLGWVWPR